MDANTIFGIIFLMSLIAACSSVVAGVFDTFFRDRIIQHRRARSVMTKSEVLLLILTVLLLLSPIVMQDINFGTAINLSEGMGVTVMTLILLCYLPCFLVELSTLIVSVERLIREKQ